MLRKIIQLLRRLDSRRSHVLSPTRSSTLPPRRSIKVRQGELMASPEKDVASLNRLYEDYWEFILKENPTFATYLGDHRYDNWLEDVSSEAYQQRIDRFRKFLSDLKRFKKPTNGEDRLNYDLFKRELVLQIEGAKYQPYLLPITQQTGPHIDLPQLITYHPFKTLQDYVNYISRLTQFRRVFDQTITNLKTGIEKKTVQPQNVVDKIIPQLEAQIVSLPDKSELYKPIDKVPSEISTDGADRIAKDVSEAIQNYVIPSYAKRLKFVREEYLPKSRTHPGAWSIPNGRAMYGYFIRLHTTTSLTPSQIHSLGKRELARIGKEIDVILRKVQFKGSLQQYNDTLRKDKSNFYTTGQELLDGVKQILRQMTPELPSFSASFPRLSMISAKSRNEGQMLHPLPTTMHRLKTVPEPDTSTSTPTSLRPARST